VLTHLRANAVAYAALFVALGGVAFAAADPLADRRGTVDSRNIQNNQIKAKDLSRGLRKDLGIAPSAKIPDGDYFGIFGDGVQLTLQVEGGGAPRSTSPPRSATTARSRTNRAIR
jgi:hypothetical protein